ncbi:MAG: HlyD family efflux transporter periplasmic adaptor subunit [Gammaproteobacteria bacterium]
MDNPMLLPHLREELKLQQAEPDPDGERSFLLYDPLANRHFRLAASFIELMNYLDSEDAYDMQKKATLALGRQITFEEIETLINFIRVNNLSKPDDTQIPWLEKQRNAANRKDNLSYLVKAPIFMRFPIWNPDRFLERSLPLARLLALPIAVRIYFACALIGILAVSQKSEEFFGTFLYFFTIEGLLALVGSVVIVKICHELGHAYVAKNFGCRVPVIGLALLVGWPVLYTDTSAAWRIVSQNKRLMIGAAGMCVELAIASVALVIWFLLEDGILRSIVFVLATTTWVISLLINLNPLMKFDGYYLLSDWLKTPNLEQRSFAVTKCFLRQKLFKLDQPYPEEPRPFLLIFAMLTWLYRLVLFTGISLLVYNFLFKALGIIFFFASLWVFIGLPVTRELRFIIEHRSEMSWNLNTLATCSILVAFLGIGIVPWKTTMVLPGYASVGQVDIYAPLNARLVYLRTRGEMVDVGDVVAKFASPQLEKDIRVTELRTLELRTRAAVAGFSVDTKRDRRLLETELITEQSKLASMRDLQEALTVRAARKGRLTDISEYHYENSWVTAGTRIATINADESTVVTAYIDEKHLERLSIGMSGKFIPESLTNDGTGLTIVDIAKSATRELDQVYLASLFGGDIPVLEDSSGRLPTQQGLYKVTLEAPDFNHATLQRGSCIVSGEEKSIFGALYQVLMAMFITELSF